MIHLKCEITFVARHLVCMYTMSTVTNTDTNTHMWEYFKIGSGLMISAYLLLPDLEITLSLFVVTRAKFLEVKHCERIHYVI
jgi:hypothetical protein